MPYSVWLGLIEEWIFNAEDRKMLKLRLLDGWTVKDLAEEFNLSPDAIKTRLRKAQKRLFKHIT